MGCQRREGSGGRAILWRGRTTAAKMKCVKLALSDGMMRDTGSAAANRCADCCCHIWLQQQRCENLLIFVFSDSGLLLAPEWMSSLLVNTLQALGQQMFDSPDIRMETVVLLKWVSVGGEAAMEVQEKTTCSEGDLLYSVSKYKRILMLAENPR